MRFRVWLEQHGQLQLPPIPTGSIRLTHLTTPEIAKLLLSGKDFSYKKQADLSCTTDSFSSNDELLQFIQTGKTRGWNRRVFGTAVVLMDIPNSEYCSYGLESLSNSVPNDRILGVVDRQTMQFTKNQRYNPNPPPRRWLKSARH
jgi:hypothetical protein